jgi:hypothetical protein
VWEIVAGAGLSALGGVLGSSSAADAQEQASKNALREQQRVLGVQLGMAEPQRYLGYNAIQDLNSLYGYGGTPYASASQLNEPTMDASAFIKAMERGLSFDEINKLGRLGTLNEAEIAKLTKAGLTAEQIQQLAAVPGSAGSGPGGAQPGQPGNMSRFFASPDYNFNRSEQLRGVEQSAAARGGAFSGNALRGYSDVASGMASREYGNYFNRLMAMAGMGQAATQQTGNAFQNYGNNASNLLQSQGDARASGILGTANSIGNAIGGGLGLWGYMQGQQQKFSPTGAQGMVNNGLANWSQNWRPDFSGVG